MEKMTTLNQQNWPLKSYAKYYYDLGLNITCISNIKNEFNSGNDNFYLKAPNHQWDDLWSRRQTIEEFNSYQWSIATGFGLATGFNDLLTIDIDDSSYGFLIQILNILGLPIDYEWIVLTGGKKGFHIYIFVNGLIDIFPVVPVVGLFPKEQYIKLVSKVELLIRLHSILPPSMHPTQNKYEFVNSSLRLPKNLPIHVGIDKIQNFIDKYFDSTKEENKKIYKKKGAKEVGSHFKELEYQCPNKPHGWRAIIFGCNLCIAERERKRAEGAKVLVEVQENRRINIERKKQEDWATYVKIEKDIRAMPRYTVWRQDVFVRYGRKCAIGDLECTKDLEVDHFPRSLYSLVSMYGIQNAGIQAYECTELWNINNGAVLCKFHHDQTMSSRYRASKS